MDEDCASDLDEDCASDLMESLVWLRDGHDAKNAEMVGFMLKRYFENHRRHIYWESVTVLSLARERLTFVDPEELDSAMARRYQ